MQVVQLQTAGSGPKPFPELKKGTSPRFPVEVLPTNMKTFADEIVRFYKVTYEAVCPAMLAAGAACIMRKIEIDERDGHMIRPVLGIVTVQESGERKSEVLSEVTQGIQKYQAEITNAYNQQEAERDFQIKIHEHNLKSLLKKAQDAAESVREDAIQKFSIQAGKIQTEIDRINFTNHPKFTANVATEAALEMLMANNGGKILVVGAEFSSAIEISLKSGFNSSADSIQLFLEGLSPKADYHDSDRTTRSVAFHPYMIVCAFMQPAVFSRIAKDYSLSSAGLLARLWVANPERRVGYMIESDTDERLNQGRLNPFIHRTYSLLKLEGGKGPRFGPDDGPNFDRPFMQISMSREARELRMKFHNEYQVKMRDGNVYDKFRSKINKSSSLATILAVVLYALDDQGDFTEGPRSYLELNAVYMNSGIQIAKFLVESTISEMKANEDNAPIHMARSILTRLATTTNRTHGPKLRTGITEGDLFKILGSKFDKESQVVQEGLGLLIELEYIKFEKSRFTLLCSEEVA